MFSLSNVVIGNGGSTIKDGGINIDLIGINNGVASAGLFNKSLNDTSTTQTIAHNLGKTPTNITFDIIAGSGTFTLNQCPFQFHTITWSSSSPITSTIISNYCYPSVGRTFYGIVSPPGTPYGPFEFAIYTNFFSNMVQGGTISADNINIYINWTQVNTGYVGIAKILWNAMA